MKRGSLECVEAVDRWMDAWMDGRWCRTMDEKMVNASVC